VKNNTKNENKKLEYASTAMVGKTGSVVDGMHSARCDGQD